MRVSVTDVPQSMSRDASLAAQQQQWLTKHTCKVAGRTGSQADQGVRQPQQAVNGYHVVSGMQARCSRLLLWLVA